MDLRQRKLFTTKEFVFKENGLHVKLKNLTSSTEVEIPFEEINLRRMIRQSKKDHVAIILGIILGLIFIFNLIGRIIGSADTSWATILIFLVLAGFCMLIAFINSKRQILLPTVNNGRLLIFDGLPTKEMSDNFISNLTTKSNEYLKHKYGSIDKDLPIDPQLSNLVWLKEKDILKSDEFEELKNTLLGKRGNNTIGFK